MSVVQLQLISMVEAEDVIAEIWRCLEEYDVRTPEMAFRFDERSRVSITMRFGDPIGANMMNLRLAARFGAEGPNVHVDPSRGSRI